MLNFDDSTSISNDTQPTITLIKKRKLYTPNLSSDEEEYRNAQIPRPSLRNKRQEIQQNDKMCVINEKAINEQAKLDEQAQNLTWTSIMPMMFRSDRQTLPTNSSLFQVRQSFNSIEKANQTSCLLRSELKREYEKCKENFSKAIKIMLDKVIKGHYDFNDEIIQEQKERKIQEEIIIPGNQLNIIVEETRENDHKEEQQQHDNRQIKSITLVNNFEILEKIFTQHEKSTVKGQNHISNRYNGINHGQFVPCQFGKYENSSEESDTKENDETKCGGSLSKEMTKEEKSRKLIEANQIINEWLGDESMNNEFRIDAGSGISSFMTIKGDRLLSRSKIKCYEENNLDTSFNS